MGRHSVAHIGSQYSYIHWWKSYEVIERHYYPTGETLGVNACIRQH